MIPFHPSLVARLLLVTLTATVLALLPSTAEARELRILEVHASGNGEGIAEPLTRYEKQLRRLFRFSRYDLVGSHSTAAGNGDPAWLRLRGGDRVELIVEETGEEGNLSVGLRWRRGDEDLVRTRVLVHRKNPALVGGPSVDGGEARILLILDVE